MTFVPVHIKEQFHYFLTPEIFHSSHLTNKNRLYRWSCPANQEKHYPLTFTEQIIVTSISIIADSWLVGWVGD
jgi:hypothetical protein